MKILAGKSTDRCVLVIYLFVHSTSTLGPRLDLFTDDMQFIFVTRVRQAYRKEQILTLDRNLVVSLRMQISRVLFFATSFPPRRKEKAARGGGGMSEP